MKNIPFLNLSAQNTALEQEIIEKWRILLKSASFIGGEEVSLFEDEFAKACNTKYCVSTSSGTDALRLIFSALGVKQDDEIITAPNTFIATTEAITQSGAKVVFCDINPKTYTIDPEKIASVITKSTVGIVPVHLYGQPADMDAINTIAERHNLWVVEDSCQAHLARYKGNLTGGLSTAAAFSFYPGKNLGACGDAGAVTTNIAELSNKIKILRDHGQTRKYHHHIQGFNNRCDALQAAALRIKLPFLDEWNQKRRKLAKLYESLLKETDLQLPYCNPSCLHVFHLFVILVKNRDLVQSHLASKGIQAGLHYPVPLHLQNAYSYMNHRKGCFPVTERSAENLLSLPIFPEMTEEQVRYVTDNIINFL